MNADSGQHWRPQTLAEVARRAASGSDRFDPALREFLDTFYSDPQPAALADAPEPLDARKDAYLAAVAEHLAERFGIAAPAWAQDRGFALTHPFFAGGLESLKASLLVESPAAFRRRLLFVGHDALSRPHATRSTSTE